MQRISIKGDATLHTKAQLISRIKPAWPFAVLLGTLFAIFWPILFGGYTLYPSDILHELFLPFSVSHSGTNVQVTSIIDYIGGYYPQRYFLQQSLRAGSLSLWNPYIYGGHPAFASNGSMPSLDPFNLLLLIPDLPAALAWRTFAQLCVSAILMYFYLKHLHLRDAAAIIGGLAFTLNSMYYANIFDWALGGFLWLPLVLLLMDKALETRRVTFMLLAGSSLGVCLLSSPLQPMAYITFIIVSVHGLRFLFIEKRKGGWRYFVPLMIILGVGFLLASIQLLPSAELFLLVRRGGSVSGRTIPQAILATFALITFVFPGLGGQMKDGMLLAQAWGGETQSQGYIGFLPLLLALLAVFCWSDRRKWQWITLALVALVVVLYTPLRSFVYDRFLIVYIFAASVWAAYGADAWLGDHLDQKAVHRVLKVTAGFVVLIAIAVVLGSVVFWIFQEPLMVRAHAFIADFIAGRYLGYNLPLHIQKLDFTIYSLLITSPTMFVPLLIAGGSIWLVYRRLTWTLPLRTLAIVAVALTAVDLGYSAVTHVPFVDLNDYPLFPPAEPMTMLQADPDLFRVAAVFQQTKEPPIISRSMLEPYGLQNIDGSDNVSSPWRLGAMTDVEGQCQYNICINPQLLNVQNVKYVLASKSIELPSEQFALIYDREMRVYQNRLVMPRAFVVHDYEVITEPTALKKRLNSPDFDPGRTVLLEEEPQIQAVGSSSAGNTDVMIVNYQPQQVDLHVNIASPGILVLTDTYYPGWVARVDGIPTRVLRANFGMRAVSLTAGEHSVGFSFEPLTFQLGLLLSISTFVCVITIIVIDSVRKNRWMTSSYL